MKKQLSRGLAALMCVAALAGCDEAADVNLQNAIGSGGQPVVTGAVFAPTGGVVTTTGGILTGTGGFDAGGDLATGGMATTGGGATTGGAATTGGVATTGGAATTGGVAATGGMAATGGVTTTGGSTTNPSGIPVRGPEPTRQSAMARGPYNVVSTKDGLRDGPDYSTQTLHYPTDAEPPYAYMTIVPGYVSPEESIIAWGPFLASHGIVVLTLAPNNSGDNPPLRARALLDGLVTLRAEHERAGSPLQGKLALDRFAVAGWSMGGGGATRVANENTDPGLRAAMSFCGWEPGYQATNNSVPTLWFATLGDPLAGGQSQPLYDSTPSTTPKTLMEMPGGDHWLANDPANYQGQIGLMGLSWMKTFLEGDERYRQFLTMEPQGLTDWRTNL